MDGSLADGSPADGDRARDGTPGDAMLPGSDGTVADGSICRCVIEGLCFDAGAFQANDPCRRCDPELSTSEWSPEPVAATCNGGTCDGTGVCAATMATVLRAAAITADYQYFGSAIAVDGTRMLIGSPSLPTPRILGRAHLFERRADGTWSEIAELVSRTGSAADLFGAAVAVDGDVAVVGAPGRAVAGLEKAGQAHVFTRQSDGRWVEVQVLGSEDPVIFGSFGSSVAVSGDWVAISAPLENGMSGITYVYDSSGSGAEPWVFRQAVEPSDARNNLHSGWSIALEDSRLLIGADGFDMAGVYVGAAYLFERRGVVFVEDARLLAGERSADASFGAAVSLEGDRIGIGAPSVNGGRGRAHVFEKSAGVWIETTALDGPDVGSETRFGTSVALSGPSLLVGAPEYVVAGRRAAGEAFLYLQNGAGAYRLTHEYAQQPPGADRRLGTAVALTGDEALVSVPYQGNGTWRDHGVVLAYPR